MMSKMSQVYIEAVNLVYDAMAEPGVITDNDILDYVNDRLPIKVDITFVEEVLDKFFNDEWATDYELSPTCH
jgi:hypothetical protein